MAVRIPIKTEGGQQAADELKKVGDAGQSAMDRVNRASKEPAAGLKALNGVTSELKGGLNDLSGSAGVVGRVLSSLGPMGLAASAGIGAFTAGLSVAIKEADEAQRAGLKVDAMLRATGSASGMTRKQIEDLAGAISETTLATQDDLIAASTQLLAFRNVSGETFGEVLRLAQDLASAGFGTLASSAVALGKSLENPGEALKALKQVGIEFTDEQLKMLDAMVSSGRAAEAQGIILEALRAKIGGTGGAEADGTLSGAFHILGERVEAFMEKIGDTGPLQSFTEFVRTMAEGMGVIDAAIFKDIDTQAADKFQELAEKKQQLDKLMSGDTPSGRTPDLMIARTRERIAVLEAELKALTDKTLAEARAERAALDAAKTARIAASEEAMMAKSREDSTKRADAAIDKHNAALKKEAAEQQRIKKVRADAAASIDGQIDSLANEQVALALAEKERAIFVEILKAEETARKAGITVTDEQYEAIRRETGALVDQKQAIENKKKADEEATKAADKAAKEREKIAEQEAEAMRKPFEHAFEGIQDAATDAFQNIFSGAADDAGDVADQIKNVFTRMAAEIATLLVFNPQASFGSVVGGLGIFGSSAASAAGTTATGGGMPTVPGASSFAQMGGGYGGAFLGAAGGAYYGYQKYGVKGAVVGGVAGYAGGAALTSGAAAMAAGWGGAASGGAALAGASSALAAIPVWGWAALAALAIFGSGKKMPSNKSAFGAIDLSTGQTSSFGNQTGDKFSQETVTARDAFFTAIKELSTGLTKLTGGKINGTISADIGQRDGTQIGGTLIGTKTFADPKAALAEIFDAMLDGMTGVSAEFRNVFDKLDTRNIDKAVKDLSTAAFIINKDYVQKDPLSPVRQALRDIDKYFDPIIRQAQRLGLAVRPIQAEENKAKGKLRANFDTFVDGSILSSTNPLQAALNDFNEQARAWRAERRALGADEIDLERMIAIKRAEIIEQYGEQANAGLLAANKNIEQFLTNVRSGSGSFLSPAATLANAEADFSRLSGLATGNDATALQARADIVGAAENLRSASREAWGSTAMFFERDQFIQATLSNLIGQNNGTTTFDNIGITIAQGNATMEFQLKALNDKVTELVSVMTSQAATIARLSAA